MQLKSPKGNISQIQNEKDWTNSLNIIWHWEYDPGDVVAGEIQFLWEGVKSIGGSLGETLCQWSAKCRK